MLSVANFVAQVWKLSPMHAFFSVMVLFGFTMLVLEQQRAIFPSRIRSGIEHWFLFLTSQRPGLFDIYVGA